MRSYTEKKKFVESKKLAVTDDQSYMLFVCEYILLLCFCSQSVEKVYSITYGVQSPTYAVGHPRSPILLIQQFIFPVYMCVENSWNVRKAYLWNIVNFFWVCREFSFVEIILFYYLQYPNKFVNYFAKNICAERSCNAMTEIIVIISFVFDKATIIIIIIRV